MKDGQSRVERMAAAMPRIEATRSRDCGHRTFAGQHATDNRR